MNSFLINTGMIIRRICGRRFFTTRSYWCLEPQGVRCLLPCNPPCFPQKSQEDSEDGFQSALSLPHLKSQTLYYSSSREEKMPSSLQGYEPEMRSWILDLESQVYTDV